MIKLESKTTIFNKKRVKVNTENIASLGLSYKVETFDKDKKKIYDRDGKCHSWTKQMAQVLMVQMGNIELTDVKDTGNTERTVRQYSQNFWIEAPATNTDYGVLAGTGTTASTISDYVMETLIAEGAGAGQLNYGATTVGAVNSDATSAWFTVSRELTNNSGGDITVTEIGMVARAMGTPYYILIARDKLDSSETITNGTSKTITYTIKCVASFTKQFIDLLCRQFCQDNQASFDITATSRTADDGYTQLQCVGPGALGRVRLDGGDYSQMAGETVGIVIGTGTNAHDITDKALQTRIEHGTSGEASKMYYYGTAVDEYTVGASTASFIIASLFHNQSGGSITVNEHGMYAIDGDIQYSHCIARKKLDSGDAIADDELYKVAYTLQATN
ncbi:MAG: hypothetical protein SV062_08020 [Thermodesulfobacteriota bacterium]|nr:hypothetical protein [Thermodesulfobacteriota bacterium]